MSTRPTRLAKQRAIDNIKKQLAEEEKYSINGVFRGKNYTPRDKPMAKSYGDAVNPTLLIALLGKAYTPELFNKIMNNNKH